MAPKRSKIVKPEGGATPMIAFSDGEEEDAGVDERGSDNGQSATGADAHAIDEQNPVEPKKKKKSNRVRKTDEEKEVSEARAVAVIEALLSDRFVWKDGKPEPFERLRKGSDHDSERSEFESNCDFVDRLHKNWQELEQETQSELAKLRDTQPKRQLGHDGEVEYVTFVWNGRDVRCETFLKVDLSDPKDVYKSSKLPQRFKEKMVEYDKSTSEDKKVRAELVLYFVADGATTTTLKTVKATKDLIEDSYAKIDSLERGQWNDWILEGKQALNGEKTKHYLKNRSKFRERYRYISENWQDWGSGRKEWTKDKKMINERNFFASDPTRGILRRPSVNGDTKAIYMAFDKRGKLIIFLDPLGIPWSYNNRIHKRMKDDAHEFFTTIKHPNPKSNKRHISQRQHLEENPALESWWCGSDHYGHWHAQQHTHEPMVETGDILELNGKERQLLLQLLKYTGGPMTRVLDFWFGVWEPNLRQRYRDIYAKSPEFARLPPVNTDHPETYSLRVAVCNRPTDEHRDQSDIKGGLTGLVHLGDFEGAAMCFNKLGIALDGYGDGAVLLLRGTELHHYISRWTGNYRYAFDHTTHQSVENSIKEHEETGRWAPWRDPEKPAAPRRKGAKQAKKPDDKDDGDEDGAGAPAKSQHRTRKRQLDDNGEGPSGDPAPKRRRNEDGKNDAKPDGGRVATRPQRKTKERSHEDDKDETAGDPAPEKPRTRLAAARQKAKQPRK